MPQLRVEVKNTTHTVSIRTRQRQARAEYNLLQRAD